MEVELNDLIKSIKKDGVEAANSEKASIVNSAKAEADKIVADARAEADKIVEDAKVEADKIVRSGEAALNQAGRDLIIMVKKSIERVFENILSARVSDAFDGEALKKSIPEIVRALGEDSADVDVLLPNDVFSEIEGFLKSELANEISNGLEIKPFDDINVGFRVSMKDGSAFYDFTEKEVSNFLARFLNPKIAKVL